MDITIISDTHLGNLKFEEDSLRPKGFSEKILKRLKSYSLSKDSILLHLGDICYEKDAEWNAAITSLAPGKKWLVTGNHDKKSASWYLSHNWDMVCESFTLFAFGKRILFSHKPLPVTFSSGIDLNIHGHFHDFSLEKIQTEEPHLAEFVGDKKHFLISLEKLNYAPVKLKHIITLFSEQENKKNV